MNFLKLNKQRDYRNNYTLFLEDWLEALNTSDCVIIVEGKKDKKALVFHGIHATRIMVLQGALHTTVDAVCLLDKTVIILTDFDSEGRKLYAQLKKGFEREGVCVDRIFREALRRYTKISHIEGM